MWGRGLRGSNGACSALPWFAVTPSATHNQIGPFWCCFLSGWVCARSRPLWVCPMTSPVRLGVSPADASTPTGVLNQWCEALFPKLEPWVAQSVARSTSCCLASQLQLCPPRSPLHNLPPRWVCQPPPCHKSSLLGLPISAPPTVLDECFFFIS